MHITPSLSILACSAKLPSHFTDWTVTLWPKNRVKSHELLRVNPCFEGGDQQLGAGVLSDELQPTSPVAATGHGKEKSCANWLQSQWIRAERALNLRAFSASQPLARGRGLGSGGAFGQEVLADRAAAQEAAVPGLRKRHEGARLPLRACLLGV